MPMPGRTRLSRGRRRLAGLALALLMVAAGAAPAAAWDLKALLQVLASQERREIAFEEQRFMSAMTTPLVSRGRFVYEPPDRLIKVLEAPRSESAVLEDGRLAILDAEGVEVASIDLWLQPDLQLVFESMKALLTGDAEALQAAFWVQLEGDETAWRLRLEPKLSAAKRRLAEIRVSGDQRQVRRFDVQESAGDRSEIRLLPEPARP